jgi:hypothetical protein
MRPVQRWMACFSNAKSDDRLHGMTPYNRRATEEVHGVRALAWLPRPFA